jgi:hypothetical protein
MHTYLAYGLGIHSELAMPQLADAKDIPADVTIRYGTLDRPEDLTTTIEASNDTIYIFMADVGGLRIRNGSEMTVDPLEGAEDLGFRFFISGIGLGLLLQQRGVFNLHASAVNIGGGAVAFIGAKFMGKSTTAASLHARGHALVTDDVLPIYIDPGTGAYHVKPGYPELKLWPDAVEATFGGSLDDLPKVHPNGPKRTLDVAKDFEQVDLPLRCIYVLEFAEADEPAVTIEPLSARAACMELAVVADAHDDAAVTGGAVGAGVHLALHLLAQVLLGGLHVAAALLERLLALHHRQPRLGAELHHILG